MDYSKIITIEPGKMGGKPCIRGLRMTVYDVLDYLASGMTENEILRDFPDLTKEDHGLEAAVKFDDVRAEEYAAMLVLGGRAPEYLRNNPRVIEIVREFDRQEKWILAICHGVQVLAAAGLVRGKRVTCYEHVRVEAETAGAIFVNEQTVRDGRIVTAQTWQSHPSFYREIFAQLTGKASAAR